MTNINRALINEVKRMEDRNADYRATIKAIKDYIDAGGDNIIIIGDLINEPR